MKLKYFLMSLVASCMALVSCNEDFEPTYLDGLRVSESYIALSDEGGSSSFTVNANDSWEITGQPDWLTVSPSQGEAGETTVTLSADAFAGRTASLKLTCGKLTQNINIIQGIAEVVPATVKEVMEGPEKPYRVTGVVTKIADAATYGNWYMNDGTSETDLYIYGTLYNGATKQGALLKYGIEVGDEVTIEGPKQIYKETVELVDVTIISVNKSLIKVESIDPEDGALPKEGGVFTVNLECKGNGIYAEVPEDAQGWLSIKSISGSSVVFNVLENTAGPRATTLVFKTTDGKKDYTTETTLSQAGAAGTLELPMTPEEAIEAANAGATTAVYVKGIVSNLVNGGFSANYGNGSFWISSDGTYNEDLSLDFEVYQANWLGGEKWNAEVNPQIEVGAEVIVYGPLTVYKGTAETQGKGAAHVYSVNGVTADANGIGTLESPFKVAGAIVAANAKTAAKVYVEGIVSELYKGGFDANYGNGSFYISEDGDYHGGDKTLNFEAYQVNYLGNQKWNAEVNPQIAVGDHVVVYGPLTVYNGLAETQGKGAAYLYKLNGQTE